MQSYYTKRCADTSSYPAEPGCMSCIWRDKGAAGICSHADICTDSTYDRVSVEVASRVRTMDACKKAFWQSYDKWLFRFCITLSAVLLIWCLFIVLCY